MKFEKLGIIESIKNYKKPSIVKEEKEDNDELVAVGDETYVKAKKGIEMRKAMVAKSLEAKEKESKALFDKEQEPARSRYKFIKSMNTSTPNPDINKNITEGENLPFIKGTVAYALKPHYNEINNLLDMDVSKGVQLIIEIIENDPDLMKRKDVPGIINKLKTYRGSALLSYIGTVMSGIKATINSSLDRNKQTNIEESLDDLYTSKMNKLQSLYQDEVEAIDGYNEANNLFADDEVALNVFGKISAEEQQHKIQLQSIIDYYKIKENEPETETIKTGNENIEDIELTDSDNDEQIGKTSGYSKELEKEELLKEAHDDKYAVIKANKWYDPEGLDIEDKKVDFMLTGSKEDCMKFLKDTREALIQEYANREDIIVGPIKERKKLDHLEKVDPFGYKQVWTDEVITTYFQVQFISAKSKDIYSVIKEPNEILEDIQQDNNQDSLSDDHTNPKVKTASKYNIDVERSNKSKTDNILDSLNSFKPSSETEDIWKLIKDADAVETLAFLLIDFYPDGIITSDDIEKLLAYDYDWVLKLLNIDEGGNSTKTKFDFNPDSNWNVTLDDLEKEQTPETDLDDDLDDDIE